MADEAQEPNEPIEPVEAVEPAETEEPVAEHPVVAEPFNEGALAAELYRAERESRTRWIVGGVGAIFCALVGGGLVLGFLYFNPGLRPGAPKTVVVKNDLPPTKQSIPNISTYHPDTTPPAQAGPPEKAPDKKTTPETTGAGPSTPPGGSKPTPPFNPFAGGGPPPDWKNGKPPLAGNISVSPEGDTVQPDKGTATNPSTAPQAQIPSEATLITGRSGGGDAESDAQEIVRALQNAGASVRSANHYTSSGGIAGVQIVASVPETALAGAKSHLQSAGVSVGDAWRGDLSERSSRIGAILSDRISDLRKAKTALLEKYLDDAPEVVQLDEEIQKLNQCLGMARISGKSAKIAIIVVGVGAL